MEPINVNGHINRANGHAPKTNGYVTSKVNITNNPLADSDEDKVSVKIRILPLMVNRIL